MRRGGVKKEQNADYYKKNLDYCMRSEVGEGKEDATSGLGSHDDIHLLDDMEKSNGRWY